MPNVTTTCCSCGKPTLQYTWTCTNCNGPMCIICLEAHEDWWECKDMLCSHCEEQQPKGQQPEDNMTDIAKFMADELDYLNTLGSPKVSDIRNVTRVPSDKHTQGYSFTFEACVNGEWIAYGPEVCGNYTCATGKEGRLPVTDSLYSERETSTIWLGFYQLDEIFGGLPLEER